MRRLSAALAIAVLAALLLPLCVSAETGYIPHEDPNAAIDELNQDAILLYYAQILMQIDQGDYASAVKMLDKLKFAHIPDAQRQLLEKYSGLIGELPDSISSSRELLNLATSLIAQYRLTEAGETLDEADGLVDQLSIYLSDIDKDTEKIGSAFDVFTAPNGSSLNISYTTLVNSVGQIWKIEDEITNLRGLLKSNLTAALAKNLQQTNLTIALSPSSAYVGDNITVSGSLSAKTSGLSGRNISILLDGRIVAATITEPGGRYTASIQLPYKYVSSMTVRALYIPAGSDLNKYLPAVSPIRNISVLFYKSTIKINPPETIYLGLPATLNGSVTWEQPNGIAARNISIYLDDNLLGTISTGIGTFKLKTAINLNESLGKHTIRAVIADSGRYAGAAYETNVTVSKAPLRIDVNAPSFLVLPGKISITGKVTSDLPFKGGTAVIYFGGKSATVDIQDNGEFSTNLSTGVTQGLLGSQELTVTVNPVEPWNAASTIKVRIFVLNAVNLTGISLCLVAGATIGTVTYTRRKRRRPFRKPVQGQAAPAAIEKILSTTPAAALQPGSGEPRERLLNIYVRAKDIIEKASAMKMEPHMTMREFSRAIEKRGIAASGNFTKLTSMAERGRYSQHEVENVEAADAEKLLSAIVEDIQRGAA
jgi:hypothetical protein